MFSCPSIDSIFSRISERIRSYFLGNNSRPLSVSSYIFLGLPSLSILKEDLTDSSACKVSRWVLIALFCIFSLSAISPAVLEPSSNKLRISSLVSPRVSAFLLGLGPFVANYVVAGAEYLLYILSHSEPEFLNILDCIKCIYVLGCYYIPK